jgi:hypothetical protein
MNPQRIVRKARDNHPRTRRSVGRPKKKEGQLVNKSGNKEEEVKEIIMIKRYTI